MPRAGRIRVNGNHLSVSAPPPPCIHVAPIIVLISRLIYAGWWVVRQEAQPGSCQSGLE